MNLDRIEINGVWYVKETSQKTEETQQDLLNEIIDKAGVNIVSCGNCGSVFLHRVNNIELCCPDCKYKSEPCDFPDLIY